MPSACVLDVLTRDEDMLIQWHACFSFFQGGFIGRASTFPPPVHERHRPVHGYAERSGLIQGFAAGASAFAGGFRPAPVVSVSRNDDWRQRLFICEQSAFRLPIAALRHSRRWLRGQPRVA